MNTRLLSSLGLLLCLATRAVAAGLPDYVRYAEDASSARLEVAIKSFALPSGQTVDLIGVVHIADAAYYQDLNRRFGAYDAVLFELVGDPSRLMQQAPVSAAEQQRQAGGSTLSLIQQAAGEYLNLTFQLGAIDYSRKNMVHADFTLEEFQKMQRERGENTLTLFGRAMRAQMTGQLSRTATSQLDTFALIRILLSEDSASEFKKALARMFDEMESMTAIMEGDQGSVILGGRNQVVVKKLREVLTDRRQRRVAVFYGGAHMPGIEASLLGEMKAKGAGEEWLAAWTMPKPAPKPRPASPPALQPAAPAGAP